MARSALSPTRQQDRATILRHPTRLAIARLCREEARTITGIAATLGMADGAVRTTVKQLRNWTVLEFAPESRPARSVYQLSPLWHSDLDEAMRQHRPIDLLEGQQCLLVTPARWPFDESSASVAWIAESEHQRLALWALLDSTPSADAREIQRTLRSSGVNAELLTVSGRRAGSRHEA